MLNKPRVITIIGPTASGKTALALKLADKLKRKFRKDVEIISADSRQVYKHIPITTAQPVENELNHFKHHFISELELNEDFNAGEFGVKARHLIRKILLDEKIPLIAGGSGLYISSLVYGLFELDIKSSDEQKIKQKEVRKKLFIRIENEGLQPLAAELEKVDPVTLEQMGNITDRRIVRALETYYITGIPISVHRSRKIEIDFEPVQVGINWERDDLYSRINKRTDQMLKDGMIDEIRSLQEKGLHYSTVNALNTVGAKEVFDYLKGILKIEKMSDLIKQNTRRFAKRQLTWFRKDRNIAWINPGAESFPDFEELEY
jgi:tRNA dimethylallyltransferase